MRRNKKPADGWTPQFPKRWTLGKAKIIAPNVNSPKCPVQITKQMVCEHLQRKHITFGLSMISVNETWQTKFISFFDTATRLLDEEKYPRHNASGFQKNIWQVSQLSLWTSQSDMGQLIVHWIDMSLLVCLYREWWFMDLCQAGGNHLVPWSNTLCLALFGSTYLSVSVWALTAAVCKYVIKAEVKCTDLFSSHSMFTILHTLFKVIFTTALF